MSRDEPWDKFASDDDGSPLLAKNPLFDAFFNAWEAAEYVSNHDPRHGVRLAAKWLAVLLMEFSSYFRRGDPEKTIDGELLDGTLKTFVKNSDGTARQQRARIEERIIALHRGVLAIVKRGQEQTAENTRYCLEPEILDMYRRQVEDALGEELNSVQMFLETFAPEYESRRRTIDQLLEDNGFEPEATLRWQKRKSAREARSDT